MNPQSHLPGRNKLLALFNVDGETEALRGLDNLHKVLGLKRSKVKIQTLLQVRLHVPASESSPRPPVLSLNRAWREVLM